MGKEDDPLIQRAAASRNTIAHVLASVPVNVNGLALGACGLGVLWQTASELLEFPPSLKLLSDLISLLTLNVAGSLVLLYLCKVITAPAAAKRDVESPDSAAILCTLDMALMSMAWVLHRHGVHVAAMAIWAFAACMHTVVLGLFLCHVFPQLFLSASALSEDAMGLQALLEAYQPAWMIPPIGICMASGTGRALGLGAWVEVFFYVGLLFFVFLLPLSIYRCHMMPLPEHLQATYAINIAPAALLLCQWVALGGNEEHALSHALFVIEVVVLGLMATRASSLAKLPLSRHLAAFTFPADISAKALMVYTSLFLSSNVPMQLLCWAFLLVSTFVVCWVFYRLAGAVLRSLYIGSGELKGLVASDDELP